MPSEDPAESSSAGSSPSTAPTTGLDPDASAPVLRGPILAPGDVLAERFRVLRLVGRGGMGEVYEAEDLELGEAVALKTIRPELVGDPAARDRFKREIQMARKVTHPNVCRTFDLERHRSADRDITFLTMEMLPGGTLAEHLRKRGRIDAEPAAPLLKQMAEGLAAAHRVGVIHRDFKPGNVVLVPAADGLRPVITDFGLACVGEDAGARAAGPRSVMGTRAYMSPEQAAGADPTPAGDVFSLGLVIRETVTGARPQEPDSLAARDLPLSLRAIIAACLDPEPGLRPATAAEVVRAFDEISGPRSGPARTTRPARRWIAVMAGLGLAAAAVAAWRAGRATLPGLEPVQVTTAPGLELFPTFSPRSDAIAFASDRSGSFQIYVRSLAADGRERPLTSEGHNFQPAWSPDGRSIAFHRRGDGVWLVSAEGGTARQLTRFGSQPAWSPDGGRLVFQSEPLVDLAPNAFPALPPSTLWVVRRDGGDPWPLTRAGQPAGGHGAPDWSPDGKRIVFSAAARRAAEIWSVAADGSDLARLVADRPYAFDPVHAADGRTVYFAAWSGRLTYGIWSVRLSPRDGRPEGLPVETANLGGSRVRHLAVSPDGRRIAYSGLTLTSNLWSVPVSSRGQRTAVAHPLTADTGKSARPAFSPDGRRLAFDRGRPGNPTDIWLMDVGTGQATPLTTHRAEESLASWFPAGDRVAFLSDRSGGFAVWSIGLEDRSERLLLDLEHDVDWPRLSPDGREIAFNSARSGGVLNTWVVPVGGTTARQLTFDRELMGFPCWSPNGKLLAVEVRRGEDTHLALVSRQGGAPRQLTSDPGQSWPYSWSPDGAHVTFAGLRNGVWNVWSVAVGTGEQAQLTDHGRLSTYVRTPAWSPRGDQIVYEYAETNGDIWMIAQP